MRFKQDLKKKLNLNFLDVTNKTICVGKYDFPKLYCDPDEYPDYLALYSQPCEYHKTEKTCVCFYNYDDSFDGRNGLYQAIYWNDIGRLNEFKHRFKGVKYFISPDYSICGDVPQYHNVHRLGRAREVSVWLTLNTGATVIPNMPCCRKTDLDYFCDGLEEVTVIAFSTKGRIDTPKNIKLLQESLIISLDKLSHLKAVIVYDASATGNNLDHVFSPVLDRGLKLIVPDNILKSNNLRRTHNDQH